MVKKISIVLLGICLAAGLQQCDADAQSNVSAAQSVTAAGTKHNLSFAFHSKKQSVIDLPDGEHKLMAVQPNSNIPQAAAQENAAL